MNSSPPPRVPQRRKREAKDDPPDPNGHSHSAKGDANTMPPLEMFPYASPFSRRRSTSGTTPKKTVQYQSDGGSTDYDYDMVQEEKEG